MSKPGNEELEAEEESSKQTLTLNNQLAFNTATKENLWLSCQFIPMDQTS